MKKIILLTATLILFYTKAVAQTVGINNNTVDTSAVLDIKSRNKGILMPRTSSSSRINIAKPAKGLLLYDTTTNSFWFYDAISWKEILTDSSGTSSNGFIEVTKQQADALIATSSLVAGSFYKISGCDTLYDDGVRRGTALILQAITPYKFSESGVGIFYNPKYPTATPGYNVWTNRSTWVATAETGAFNANELITANNGATGKLVATLEINIFIPLTGSWITATSITGNVTGATATISDISLKTYTAGSKVIWGGYLWTNLSGNVGNKLDLLRLNSAWTKNVYDTTNYDIAIDEVSFNYEQNWITRRFEMKYDNEVSGSYISGETPWRFRSISVFMFGNMFVHGNRVIQGSYFETVDFTGYIIAINIVDINSQIQDNTYTNGSSFNNNIISQASTFSGNTFVNNSFFRRNIIRNKGYLQNCTFTNKSEMVTSTLSNQSSMLNTLVRDTSILADVNLLNDSQIGSTNFKKGGIYFMNCNGSILNGGLAYPIVNKYISSLTGETGTINANISAATLLFTNYPKTLYKRPDGTNKLRYYNNSDIMVIANVTD